MSKNKETETDNKEVSTVEASKKGVDNTKAKTSEKSTGIGFLLFLLLLLVSVGVAGAYYFWETQQKQAKLIKEQARGLSALKQQSDQFSQSGTVRSRDISNNASQLQQLAEQIQQTENISQQAIDVVNRSQRGWALAEVDYLLRMAHQRIAVARDIAGAIAALKGADNRIERLGDLNLFKIRKQLAKDIANLNAIHQADVNGISLSIDHVIAYLPELPFKSIKDEIKVQFAENKAIEQPGPGEESFMDSVLDTVKKIGDIKVHQRSIQAASGAEQQNQIEQLLRTYLLSARLAALRFDQTQFLHEVQQASEILRLHYDVKDNRVQQLQKSLSDYSALQLSPDLPELTKAWSMLQEELESSPRIKKTKSKTNASKADNTKTNKKTSDDAIIQGDAK